MKVLSPALLAAALTLAGTGSATATVMKYTATTTLTTGTDGLGLFGPASASLAGKSIALTLSFDTALNASQNNNAASIGNAPVKLLAVIGGVEYASLVTVSPGTQSYASAMNNMYPGASYPWNDEFDTGVMGTSADGLSMSAWIGVQSSDPNFVTGSSTVTDIFSISSPAYLSLGFYATGAKGSTQITFDGSTGRFTAEQLAPAAPANVPEPASLALLGAGALGLAWRRRTVRNPG